MARPASRNMLAAQVFISPYCTLALFQDRVLRVFLVLADVLDQLRIGHDLELHGQAPGLGVGFGIVDRELDLHMAEVAAAEALDGAQRVAMRMAGVIEPTKIVEALGLDCQNVAVPAAHGVSEPRGTHVRREDAAVRENLAEARELLVKNQK